MGVKFTHEQYIYTYLTLARMQTMKKKSLPMLTRVARHRVMFQIYVPTIHHPTEFVRTNKLGVRLYSRTKQKREPQNAIAWFSDKKKRVTSPQKLAHS